MPKKLMGYQSASGRVFDTREEAERDEAEHLVERLFEGVSFEGWTGEFSELVDAILARPEILIELAKLGGLSVYTRKKKES